MRFPAFLGTALCVLVVACGDNKPGTTTSPPDAAPVTVGGSVSGLVGSGLVLRINDAENLAVASDGTFRFLAAIPIGTAYAVTVGTQPSDPAQLCTVENGTGTVQADVTNIEVTCATQAFTVGGTVTGLAGTGLVLHNNGTDALTVAADGTFTFATSLESGTAFAVTIATQPSGPTQTCDVSGGSGTVGGGNVTTVVVNCAVDRFTVGGEITGLEGTVVLQNNAGDDITLDSTGTFAFPTTVASGADYAVTVLTQPGTPSQTCTVTAGTGTVTNADVTSVRVACETDTFTVGGTVTGLEGDGLVLQNNAGDNLALTSAASTFTFPTAIASGEDYTVTVLSQPSAPTQECVVVSGAGTVAGANVTNVEIVCTTRSFTIGGAVTGLVGTGLVLQNNSGDDLAVTANGTFTFAAPIASGETFAVTVLTQPSGPAQTCTVSGGTGTVGGSNVTGVVVDCATNKYTVGGSVAGLVGTVTLRINAGETRAVTSNGTFAFPTAIESGSAYAVTVLTQPSGPTQTCVVANGTGTVVASDITSVSVTCTTNRYQIRGTVVGLDGTGLVLQNNGGNNRSITGNGTFAFSTTVESGATYAVTVLANPSSKSQTCVVTNGAGVVGGGDVTDVTVTCTTNTYTVGGTVTGLEGAGLVLRNNGGDNKTIVSNGTFEFTAEVASGGTYAVTVFEQPTDKWQTCAVTSGTGTVTSANITNVAVTCTTNTYAIGGSVVGLTGSGLVLQNNGGPDLAVTGASFTFPAEVASGATYAVTIKTQPTNPSQTCTLSGATGTVGGGDVDTVVVNCATNTYTVGGTVSGLEGSGLVLRNNGGDDIVVAPGASSFTFATPVASGAAYAVTAFGQPSTPTQTCVVSNGSGTVTSANVTNVSIACTTRTFTISATVSGLATNAAVTLRNNGANQTVRTANGAFTFSVPVASGAAYNVTVFANPTSPSQTCTVANGSGTVGAANVTNVAVTCVTSTYTVGGTITGLTSGTVVLQNNGANSLSRSANGAFTFSAPVPSGQPYAVTVQTQPAQLYCVVSNGAGTVTNANVTNVAVTCMPCNPSVLVLGDGRNQALVDALNASGLSATLFANTATYTGTPSAANYGAVLVIGGDEYDSDMPGAGQTSIVNANSSTTGVVFTEWVAYQRQNGRYNTLAPLVLLERESGTEQALTFTVEAALAAHPLWAGLPASFSTTPLGTNMGGVITNGGTLLATCPECQGAGVAFRDTPGRVVQQAHAAVYNGYTPWADANVLRLMVNSAKWAARCQ